MYFQKIELLLRTYSVYTCVQGVQWNPMRTPLGHGCGSVLSSELGVLISGVVKHGNCQWCPHLIRGFHILWVQTW